MIDRRKLKVRSSDDGFAPPGTIEAFLLICADTGVNFGLGKADIGHHLAAYLFNSMRKPNSRYPFRCTSWDGP
jgi:hypothetical protein